MNIEDKLRSFAQAYPIDIFTPLTADERARIGDLSITKCSAEMGRHFAPFALEAADRIRELEALCEDVFAWNDFDEFREWRLRFEACKGSSLEREVSK